VYLKSPAKLPFVALVESVGPVHVRCRWFYRLADLPAQLRKAHKNTQCCELFLSSHHDVNDFSSVIRKCHVTQKSEQTGASAPTTMVIDGHLVCRFAFDVQKQSLHAVSNWKTTLPSNPTIPKIALKVTSTPRDRKSGESSAVPPETLGLLQYGDVSSRGFRPVGIHFGGKCVEHEMCR
jgi:hypothetical protein